MSNNTEEGKTLLRLRDHWERKALSFYGPSPGRTVYELGYDSYDRLPAAYNKFIGYFERRMVERLLDRCGDLRSRRALDAGCGGGRWAALLASRGVRTVGVDLSATVLAHAKSRYDDIQFSQMSLSTLALASDVFDVVTCVTVLVSIPRHIQDRAIPELVRVTRPGGYILILELADLHDNHPATFPRSYGGWIAAFDAQGVRLVASGGCEYVPLVRLGKLLSRLKRALTPVTPGAAPKPMEKNAVPVPESLATNRLISILAWLPVLPLYPLEYLASRTLPGQWARLGAFLFQKRAAS